MHIHFECPSCHKALKAPQENAGRQGKCGKCGQAIVVPEAEFIIEEDEGAHGGANRNQYAPPPYPAQQPQYTHQPYAGNTYASNPADGLLNTFFIASILSGVCFGIGLASESGGLILLALIGMAAASVIHLVLIYRWWETIQQGRPRTTPGKAVGLLFVPFFNFYWLYQVIVGLGEDMNRFCDERQIAGARVNVGNGNVSFWLMLSTMIPLINLLTSIPAMIFTWKYYRQLSQQAMLIRNGGYSMSPGPSPHWEGGQQAPSPRPHYGPEKVRDPYA